MKKRVRLLTFLFPLTFVLILSSVSSAQEKFISPADAHKYVGEKKTVCGQVASATYAARSRRQPTFLNLDRPYPNHIFTVVIWGSDRNKFKTPPETLFKAKTICVTGVIDVYRGKPQIIVRDPSQIVIK